MITGGAGSLGRMLVKEVFTRYEKVSEVIIYSRDELKHHHLSWEYPSDRFPIKYVIGDVRDYDRLASAMEGVDFVIHSAAMKQVGSCETNPEECYKTNILGSQNVIKAAKFHQIQKTVLISSDKAVEPISVYGNSKQAAEKLFLKADEGDLQFSIVRLGNLLGSDGSVIPIFKHMMHTGLLPVTHPDMTRFAGTIKQGADCVLTALNDMTGGEIFVPKWKSFLVSDLVEAIAPGCEIKIIGLRKYEKMHEKLISEQEIQFLKAYSTHFIIKPNADQNCEFEVVAEWVDHSSLSEERIDHDELRRVVEEQIILMRS